MHDRLNEVLPHFNVLQPLLHDTVMKRVSA